MMLALKVSVSQTIDAAHQLTGTGVHGHTYKVTLSVIGGLRSDGMVESFGFLSAILAKVLAPLDHVRLEDTLGRPATAERLAEYVAMECREQLFRTCTVRVDVGSSGFVEYCAKPL